MARGEAEHDEDWRAAAARRFLAPLAVAVVGGVVVAATGGTLELIGWAVVALAVVVVVSLVFLEVGYSEDRERERSERP